MFGSTCPRACATCNRDELLILSRPAPTPAKKKEEESKFEPHVWRRMVIRTECERCVWFYMNGKNLYGCGTPAAIRDVYLPTRIVADARVLMRKFVASGVGGTKPANADLQLVNLLACEREGPRAMAYMTVGLEAILTEPRVRAQCGMCGIGGEEFVNKCAEEGTGTPWKHVRFLQEVDGENRPVPGSIWDPDDADDESDPDRELVVGDSYAMRRGGRGLRRTPGRTWRVGRPISTAEDEQASAAASPAVVSASQVRDRFMTTQLDPPRMTGAQQGGPPPGLDAATGAVGAGSTIPLRMPFQLREHEAGTVVLAAAENARWQETSEAWAPSLVAEAERLTMVGDQQLAFTTGTPLVSTTVVAPGSAVVEGQAEGAEIGTRVAHARFPTMSEEQAYLFSNDPRNLEAANTMRNVGVGQHKPSESEATCRKTIVESLKTLLFTDRRLHKAMAEYESLARTALPKKLSEEEKAQWHLDAMNEAEGMHGVAYSKFMDAFVKAEVSNKPKPRPIANHKQIRLVSMARVAWAFEWVMFHTFKYASIKHRAKSEAISDIAKHLSEMRNGRWAENDMTAFEFGIGSVLKECEVDIFRHIHKVINGSEANDELFERVCDDRTKACVWTMTYKDESGEKRRLRLQIPRTMRESGDRLTSSGNWFQNLLAWLSFLVHPDHVDKAITSLINTQGRMLFYISARDGKKYLAMFVWEGDDTLARLEEPVWLPHREGSEVSLAEDFFIRWGWKAKLSWKATEGYDYARVVGYDILLKDGKAVLDGSTLVAMPEMRRLLTTKQWTTTSCTPMERKTCTRVFAATLGAGFVHCEPMWAFLKSVYDANRGGQIVSDAMVREQYFALTGELPEHGASTLSEIEFPQFEGGGDAWKELARVSAGDFSDLEWATACAEVDMNVHGADLSLHMPASWVGRATLVMG